MHTAGQMVRERRIARGWPQAVLAHRAGTTQAVVSRIERGLQSPTTVMLQRLLGAMGFEVQIVAVPNPHVDPAHLAAERRLTMEQRLERAFHWMRFNAALHGQARAAAGTPGEALG
jgi:transcriptional regulator with XRE-family HTH domain